MRLNPEDKRNWHGFLDLMQPPTGYRLRAALGTTFSLSVDALVAALLSMCDADDEEMANNPVAATMAITRLSNKVRILVHPATTNAPAPNKGPGSFIALLDRLVVEVQPNSGLFHPKVWVLRFELIGPPKHGIPKEVGRILVGSRNLVRSTSFELGAAFEGSPGSESDRASQFGVDLERALREWLDADKARYPEEVRQLPGFVRRLSLDMPHECSAGLRLLCQRPREPLSKAWPESIKRAVAVTPFMQPDFVTTILARTRELRIVSIPGTLDALPDETFAALDARSQEQKSPVLYQVTEHGNPDDAYIDCIHAKLLLTEDHLERSATFVGSANATGPGWGLTTPANIEAMIEMRPGIGIDEFIRGFIRENNTKVHPWISEYDRSARSEPIPEKELERHMLAALREVAKLRLTLRYDTQQQRLTLSKAVDYWSLPEWVSVRGLEFSLAPFLLAGKPDAWRSLAELDAGGYHFDSVPIARVTTFVALRARSRSPAMERQRILMAKLDVADSLLDERDQAIRAEVMATADPAMVLNALVRGLAHVRVGESFGKRGKHHKGSGLGALLADTSLERLLQAVALDPSLVREMRLLLEPQHGEQLRRLCDDLDAVIASVHAETPR